jgi:hypothetical protein
VFDQFVGAWDCLYTHLGEDGSVTEEYDGRWIDNALRRDDSLFTPGTAVWSRSTAEELHRHYNLQLDTASGTYLLVGRKPMIAGSLRCGNHAGPRERHPQSKSFGWLRVVSGRGRGE